MTLCYSHLSPGHLRNAVAAIDRALTSLSDPTFTIHFTVRGVGPERFPFGDNKSSPGAEIII
jgi:hypothetical protein